MVFKKYLIIGIIVLIPNICLYIGYKQYTKLNNKYKYAIENVKTYSLELNENKKYSGELKLTIGQLEYFRDSILNKMDSLRKVLKIKDKQLERLQYIQSDISKVDTIIVNDTIFKESIKIDTLIQDDWYSLKLDLYYPNTIIINPIFKSSLYVITSLHKETINPPKKFFLFRWFQKKHKVIRMEVVEENPYIKIKQSKFVQIIK